MWLCAWSKTRMQGKAWLARHARSFFAWPPSHLKDIALCHCNPFFSLGKHSNAKYPTQIQLSEHVSTLKSKTFHKVELAHQCSQGLYLYVIWALLSNLAGTLMGASNFMISIPRWHFESQLYDFHSTATFGKCGRWFTTTDQCDVLWCRVMWCDDSVAGHGPLHFVSIIFVEDWSVRQSSA